MCALFKILQWEFVFVVIFPLQCFYWVTGKGRPVWHGYMEKVIWNWLLGISHTLPEKDVIWMATCYSKIPILNKLSLRKHIDLVFLIFALNVILHL